MSEQRFDTSLTPHITVEQCQGDLAITAAAAPEVVVEFGKSGGEVRREGETLQVTAHDDCEIVCPPGSSITLQHVGGDLSARDLTGTLAVQSVGGDAAIRGVGVATLQSVNADLSARDVAGSLTVENVGGDLEARDVGGDLRAGSVGSDLEVRRIEGQMTANQVHGDVSARGLKGGAVIEQVGGDASIETDLGAGKTYRIRAGGDVRLRLPLATSARFTLQAGGEIEDHLGLVGWSGDSHAGQGALGSGEAQVELSAGGDLALLPARDEFDFNLDAIGSQLEAKLGQFEHEMEGRMRELNEQLARMAALGAADIESRLRRVDIEGIGRHAERVAERARQHAVRAAERARHQAERAAERARRAERGGKSRGFRFNVDVSSPWSSPQAGRPASTPDATGGASEAERRMILHMLEERKITAEEASRLLQALEG
jgi:hypothetical protein